MKIFLKVTQLTVVSVLVFYAIHYFAKPQPKTMSKEWQEASNEYALVCLLYRYLWIDSDWPRASSSRPRPVEPSSAC